MPWLAIRLFLGGAASKLWSFLKSLSFWQLAFGAVSALALLFYFQRNDARSDAARWQKQDEGHVAELKRISTVKNNQAVVTRDRIKVVTQRIHDADGKANVIERAPLSGNCKTPREILQADL